MLGGDAGRDLDVLVRVKMLDFQCLCDRIIKPFLLVLGNVGGIGHCTTVITVAVLVGPVSRVVRRGPRALMLASPPLVTAAHAADYRYDQDQ